MLVDYERAWLAFKREIVQKKSHGQRDLLAEMARIEVECEVEEFSRDFDPTPHVNKNGRSTVATSRER